jgi:hypothetical protein
MEAKAPMVCSLSDTMVGRYSAEDSLAILSIENSFIQAEFQILRNSFQVFSADSQKVRHQQTESLHWNPVILKAGRKLSQNKGSDLRGINCAFIYAQRGIILQQIISLSRGWQSEITRTNDGRRSDNLVGWGNSE